MNINKMCENMGCRDTCCERPKFNFIRNQRCMCIDVVCFSCGETHLRLHDVIGEYSSHKLTTGE